MTTTTGTSATTVWLLDDVPVRMIHEGRRWRVTDTPTRLEREPWYLPPGITHPGAGFDGWRFQGTDIEGTSHIFDVLHVLGQWVVTRIVD